MALSYEEFQKVDVRVGRIIGADNLEGAKKSAYKLRIDFGAELGVKSSSAQITKLYGKEQLINKLVICVINFAPKRIAGFESEVLTLGVSDKDGNVVLLSPDSEVGLGARMF